MASTATGFEEVSSEMQREVHRFVRVPLESVQSCADQMGLKTTEDVPGGIVEDVSFRLRQIANTASHFMHHSKRRRLTVEDMNKAMRFNGLEMLYGYDCPASDQHNETEEDLELDDMALAPVVESSFLSTPAPSMTTPWLMVEGVELGRKGGQEAVQISSAITESQQSFLSTILEVISGDNEDYRRIVLTMVQCNMSVASVLPALVNYLQETLMKWDQFSPVQLDRVLKLVLALFQNSGLFLDPYCSALFPHLKEIILSATYLSVSEDVDASSSLSHWDVRKLAAACLAQLLTRCSSKLTAYLLELSDDFRAVFLPSCSSSLAVRYGVILVLVFHGPASVVELFCPHMQALVRDISSLAESGTAEVKQGVDKVMEAILLTAELLLTSEVPVILPISQITDSSSSSSSISRSASDLKASSSSQGFVSPGSDVMDSHSKLASSSSAPRTTSSSGGAAPGGLFGGPSLALHSSSVLENDLQETAGSRSRIKSKDALVSLYGYFADLFGEGLSVRLASHDQYKGWGPSKPPHKGAGRYSIKSPPDKKSEEIASRAADRFFEREGFKPAHVQLPSRKPLAPSMSHQHVASGGRTPWTFPLPQAMLPVSENPLEKKRAVQQNGRGQRVIKGPRIKGESRRRDFSLMDVGTAWI